jgi:hypothetical protein
MAGCVSCTYRSTLTRGGRIVYGDPVAIPDRNTATARQRSELTRLLSRPRLTGYAHSSRRACDGIRTDPLDTYVYNMALAAAYLGPLHLVEITTRNAMNDQLARRFGRADWWNSEDLRLVYRQEADLRQKIRRLETERNRRHLPPPTPDDIVAALDFGFWTGLLKSGDKATGVDYERSLWQKALRHAFPLFRGRRSDLYVLLNQARNFRNRVSHHEPIHNIEHRRVLERLLTILGYTSVDVAAWCAERTTVADVAARSPDSDDAVRSF